MKLVARRVRKCDRRERPPAPHLFHIDNYVEIFCNIVSSLFCAIDSIISMIFLLLGIDSAPIYSKLINLTHSFCCILDLVRLGKRIDLGLNFSRFVLLICCLLQRWIVIMK